MQKAVESGQAPADIERIDRASPSLYIVERALKTKMNNFEHYVFPLQTSCFFEDTGRCSLYYSTSRSREDIKNGWEYSGDIAAEYFPPAHHHTP